jgi:hypothetical protein
LVYLLVILIQHQKLARWVKRQSPLADARIPALLAEVKATLGVRRHLTVVPVPRACAPALFGVRHPVLLMPANLARTLEPAELRHILLHELVHLKHHDVLLNYLLMGVQALHWFNPAVWLALRRLRAERELYCDALVIKRLDDPGRRAYGSALLKVCEHLARPVFNPHLVPILGHKPQIHRRILMITHFKPTSRRAAAASLLLALGLGGFTFTKAVENQNPPTPPAPAPAQPAPAPNSPKADADKIREKNIKALSELQAEQQALMLHKQKELDDLRAGLGIADEAEANAPFSISADHEAFRKLESMRIEAQAEYKRALIIYSSLTNLSRSDLRQAAPTVVPDPLLNALLERAQTAEQKLAELLERQTAEHPEVTSLNKLMAQVNKQIEVRLDGILAGLKLKMAAEKARAEELDKIAQQYKHERITQAIRRRPYDRAKRDLESLQKAQDLLALRLLEEKIDQQIGRARSPQP